MNKIINKHILIVIVAIAICCFCSGIYSSAQNPNTCLDCHGSADKLKTLIKDEDFNKNTGEGYG